MTERTMTDADQAFYGWLHVHAEKYGTYPLSQLRQIFMAGWTAHLEAGQSGE